MAQVGSQSEDLEPSLKEADTDVNWEVVGPIIAGDYFLLSYTFLIIIAWDYLLTKMCLD